MSAGLAQGEVPEDDEDDEEFGFLDHLLEEDDPPLALAPLHDLDDDDDDDDAEPSDEAELGLAEEEEPPPAPPEPVAPPKAPCDVVVGAGDCVLSLARRYDTSVDAIWSHPANAELRQRRPRPNLLMAGDVVHVPAKAERSVTVATERRHRFRLAEREDCEVVIRLRRRGVDRAGVDFTLVIDGHETRGVTDGTGRARARAPRSARAGWLVLHDPAGEERYPVRLGHLDPLDEAAPVTGAQARLNHLGFPCGAVDGHLGPRTRGAVRRFQRSAELPPTGDLDAATCAALTKAHGS